MIKKLLIEIGVLILPVIVFSVHQKFPGNQFTPYFIPKNLTERKYPKAVLRQSGVAYWMFALWIFSFIAVTTLFFLPAIEKIPVLLAALFFILPIILGMSLLIGLIYLCRGLFGRDDTVKPGIETIYQAEKEQLPKYIRKIKIYNGINLSCPLLLMIAIPLEEWLGIAQNGYAILFNVSLLITFIMTLWRIRAYLVKAAMVMDLSANKILSQTLGSPLGIFFVWIHSFLMIKKFKQQNQAKEKH